ncbi:fluoride efflux transporter CrcB [Neobacillus drentensis]|uniref:fluoride efflux transporter CrcB n=1 Tax=Neobacillus drentensis TaxID=220684 RepID=UPI003000BDEA
MTFLFVGIAGIIGALLRYLLGIYVGEWWFHEFPLATLVTNMAGSFLLGWFTNFLPRFKSLPPYVITALNTGLIGSFTTFSTFSVETVHLISAAKWGTAILYVLLSLWGGLLLCWMGYRLGLKTEESTEVERGEK